MRVRAWLAPAMLASSLVGCGADRGTVRGAGTIEMNEIDIASLVGGRLARLEVAEGDTVRAGDTLAVLDRGEVLAELSAQIAQTQRAQAQASDLAQGARPAEVVMAREQLRAAQADLRLAQADFARAEKLAATGVIAPAELDRARAARDAGAARVSGASEQLRLQESGFRRKQVEAAREGATAAVAQLAGARSRAGELVLIAPSDGVVLLANFDAGEIVPPGIAVVTLGRPDSLWLRVYIAAPRLADVHLGAPVDVRPVGSKQTYPGRVVTIASVAEFTPRAALTEEEQANLVFAVKVALARSGGVLKAGVPADARIRVSTPANRAP